MFWEGRAAFAAFLGVCCAAQTRVAITPRTRPEIAAVRTATFRMDARLVQIPVTVSDALDHPRLNLSLDDFRVLEDGVEQQISSFSMADGPMSAGIVFDTSGSMKPRIQESREALDLLLQTAVPLDEFFLMRFSDRPELLVPLTRNPDEISRRLGSVVPHGWTALYDAIFYSLQEVRHAGNPRRALLVLSDGEDNNSRYSESEVLSLAREADVRIYAIGLFREAHWLAKAAEETGGRIIWVRKMADLPDAVRKLSLEMRNVYLLGYFSKNPPLDGKYRKVKVELRAPADAEPLRVDWRRGYYAQ